MRCRLSRRYGMAATALGAVALVGACASGANAPTTPPPAGNNAGSGSWPTLGCTEGIGFSADFGGSPDGEPTPEKAVARYVAQSSGGGIARHLNPPPRWQVTHDADGVRFWAADVSLHVIQFPSGGWVVDSGQYCR
jgi:hypothetical protein